MGWKRLEKLSVMKTGGASEREFSNKVKVINANFLYQKYFQ